MKVMTIVGTRPELIKLCRVIVELDAHLNHILVHTGQNYDYELSQIFFEDLGIRKPDHFLEVAQDTLAGTIGQIIARSDAVMESESPDAVLLYGDTNSCLSVISAKRRQIPVFHMEAGNRCFDQRVPEEINRKVVDHLSDINMPLTEHARRYLIAEGIRSETIIKVGSCMKEVLNFYREKILASHALEDLGLKQGKYFLASFHREENVDYPENLENLVNSLVYLSEEENLPIIVSTHPRTRKRIEAKGIEDSENIKFLKPLGFSDYVWLQQNARCVISDSGTLTEESSLLSFPGVMIRNAHERPEGMDQATVIMSGLTAESLIRCVKVAYSHQSGIDRVFDLIPDYNVENVSKKVLRIILSYTEYVNRTVWHKT